MKEKGEQWHLGIGEDDDALQLGGLLLRQGAVGPFLLQAALRGPPPVAGVEDQRHHVPRHQHVHGVVLARGHYQERQHRCSRPDDRLLDLAESGIRRVGIGGRKDSWGRVEASNVCGRLSQGWMTQWEASAAIVLGEGGPKVGTSCLLGLEIHDGAEIVPFSACRRGFLCTRAQLDIAVPCISMRCSVFFSSRHAIKLGYKSFCRTTVHATRNSFAILSGILSSAGPQ